MVPEVIGLAGDLLRFGRARASRTLLLMVSAGVLEGIGLAFLVPMLGILAQPEGNGFTTKMLDAVLPSVASPMGRLAAVLVIFIFIMAGRTVALAARDKSTVRLQLDFSQSLQIRLLRDLAITPWQRIDALQHAKVTQALGAGITRVSGATQLLLLATVSLGMLLAQWLIAFLIAPRVALAFLGLAALGAVPFMRALNQSSALGKEMNVGGLALTHTTGQLLGGLKLAFAQNMQGAFVSEYAILSEGLKDRRVAFQFKQISNRAGLTFGAALIGAATLFIGSGLGTPLPKLLAMFAIFIRMNTAAIVFVQCCHQLVNSAPAYIEFKSVLEQFERSPDIALPAPAVPAPAFTSLVLNHVTVGAASAPRLVDASLDIRPGEMIGIAGPSGAGKTTLLDSITGLLRPNGGSIYLNGTPMDEDRARTLRDRISYVTQDGFMLNDTIARNLMWGQGEAAPADIWRALAIAQAAELVRQTPDGLDTMMNERGTRLSGGERQRIALGRAILRNPDIMILDEATNAIDIETEIKLFEALKAACPKMATIIVAHRVSTLERCDRIVTLKDGLIVSDELKKTREDFLS